MKKISFFDLILTLIFIFLAIFLFIFLFRKNQYIEVVVKITNDNVLYAESYPPNWFVNLLKKGMSEKDGLGRVTAEIKDIYWYDSEPTRKAAYLLLRIKATYNKKANQYSYKGKPLLVASPIKIQFEKVLVNGLVTNIQGLEDSRETKVMLMETQLIENNGVFPNVRGVEPFLAEAINIGDEVKSHDGSSLIKIIDKKVFPATRIVTNDRGQVFLEKDPLLKDVYLTLKVKVKKINNEYYLYDDIHLKIGRGIPVNLEKVTVWPTITQITNILDKDNDFK